MISRHSFDASLNPNGSSNYQKQSGRSYLEQLFEKYADIISESSHHFVQRACPLCGMSFKKDFLQKYGVPISVCSICGFVYVSEIPSATLETQNGMTFLDRLDGAHLDFIESAQYQHYASLRYRYELDLLTKFIHPPSSLLDVGCSTGQFLKEARCVGWDTYGVEVSRKAAQIAADRMPNIVNDSFAPELFGGKKFAVLASLDVIEHVAEPEDFIRSMATSLSKDGIMLVQVPNAGSLASLLKRERDNIFNGLIHLNYFTPKSLKQLGKNAGLELIHCETILSEYSTVIGFSHIKIAEVISMLGLTMPPQLTPDFILDAGLGYKVVAIFRHAKKI